VPHVSRQRLNASVYRSIASLQRHPSNPFIIAPASLAFLLLDATQIAAGVIKQRQLWRLAFYRPFACSYRGWRRDLSLTQTWSVTMDRESYMYTCGVKRSRLSHQLPGVGYLRGVPGKGEHDYLNRWTWKLEGSRLQKAKQPNCQLGHQFFCTVINFEE